MSGELQVVFVYDTLQCRKEEDDPGEAILYFHPEGLPESRRIAICGQLMGITQFLVDMFSPPKIITLANGKFALRDFGKQYILALGCSSVTPDWLLEKQADILYQVTKFFHKDIDAILNAVGKDRTLLAPKLSCIMDHYIPISQHHGDLFALTFGILPILILPKSASQISLNATVLLHTCMLGGGVLGGLVMFQNKVIAAELMQDLARKLAFIQPYQLPPADAAHATFSLPPGVQLLKVYVKQSELKIVREHASAFQKTSLLKKNNSRSGTSSSSPTMDISDEKKKCQNDTDAKNSTNRAKQNSPIKSKNSSASGQRLFQSWDALNIQPTDEDEQDVEIIKPVLKTRSTSINDPFFPYLRCDGKCISKPYYEANTFPNPDAEGQEENCDSKVISIDVNTVSKINEKLGINSLHENNKVSEKENEPPSNKLTGRTDEDGHAKVKSANRPKDLALNTGSSKRTKSKKKWSTFEDMMSPVLENPPVPLEVEPTSKPQIHDRNRKPAESSDSSMKATFLSSFRKLSSHESDSGRGSEISPLPGTADNKRNYKSSPIPPKLNATNSNNTNTWMPFGRTTKTGKTLCKESESTYEDLVLFIYSLGGMRLLLLLEKSCLTNRDIIYTLREYGSTSIADLEASVSNVEEQSMSVGAGHHDHYCYLHYEPVWKSLAHGGRNHSMDFDVVQQMHQDFQSHPNISELIIRGNDHVVYGYQCVGSEVFYQQSAGPQPGLPMPSDLMGKVPVKARRRLERDHSILLL